MRTFAPLADGGLPVPGELLDALVDALGAPGSWVLIGAAARDLALILGGVSLPRRATNDVDIAIAAQDALAFDTTLATLGEPTRAWAAQTATRTASGRGAFRCAGTRWRGRHP